MPRLIRILFFASLPLVLAGCMLFTTKKEGTDLRKQVETLSGQVKAVRAREKATLSELRKAYGELKELKEILPKARQILLRSSARFGVKLDQLSADVGKLKGQMENLLSSQGGDSKERASLKSQVAKLAENLGRVQTELTRLLVEVRKRQADPTTAATWWARATMRRLAGRFPEARQDYQQLIQKHPRDRRVPGAYYYIAKTWFDAYDYKRAVVEVARLLKARPGSRFDARARLLSARSYFELKRCRTAMRILSRLVRRHPHAEITPQAKALLARLNRIQRVSRFCRR